jgi:hypothetical protein
MNAVQAILLALAVIVVVYLGCVTFKPERF